MALQPCSPARYRELPLLIRQPPWLSWQGPPDVFCAGSRRNLASRVGPPTTLPIGMSKGVLSNQSTPSAPWSIKHQTRLGRCCSEHPSMSTALNQTTPHRRREAGRNRRQRRRRKCAGRLPKVRKCRC